MDKLTNLRVAIPESYAKALRLAAAYRGSNISDIVLEALHYELLAYGVLLKAAGVVLPLDEVPLDEAGETTREQARQALAFKVAPGQVSVEEILTSAGIKMDRGVRKPCDFHQAVGYVSGCSLCEQPLNEENAARKSTTVQKLVRKTLRTKVKACNCGPNEECRYCSPSKQSHE